MASILDLLPKSVMMYSPALPVVADQYVFKFSSTALLAVNALKVEDTCTGLL